MVHVSRISDPDYSSTRWSPNTNTPKEIVRFSSGSYLIHYFTEYLIADHDFRVDVNGVIFV